MMTSERPDAGQPKPNEPTRRPRLGLKFGSERRESDTREANAR